MLRRPTVWSIYNDSWGSAAHVRSCSGPRRRLRAEIREFVRTAEIGTEASILKVRASELYQDILEASVDAQLMDAVGAKLLLEPILAQRHSLHGLDTEARGRVSAIRTRAEAGRWIAQARVGSPGVVERECHMNAGKRALRQ